MISKKLNPVTISEDILSKVAPYNIKGGWDKDKDDAEARIVITQFKSEIKEKTYDNQNGLCAYCERPLAENSPEIEHIANKARYPEQTFNPNNLACSCRRCNGSKHKGKNNVVSDNSGDYKTWKFTIVHPYFDDPKDFFELRGAAVMAKPDISTTDKIKAKNTIKMFALNCEAFLNEREQKAFFECFTPEQRAEILKASGYKDGHY